MYSCSLISDSSASMHLRSNSPSLIRLWVLPFPHPTYQHSELRNSLPWKDILEFQGRVPSVCHRTSIDFKCNRDRVMIKRASCHVCNSFSPALDWESPGVRDSSLDTVTTLPGMRGAQNSVVCVCVCAGGGKWERDGGTTGLPQTEPRGQRQVLDEESFDTEVKMSQT